jgi:hypothetical protein
MASDGRSYVTGYFQLTLDGIDVGIVQKVSGGNISADRVELHDSPELAFQAGLSMGQPVKDWVEGSLAGNYMRKSGELRVADAQRKVKQVIEFEDALITEIGFPALDASGKEPAYLTVAFAARSKRVKPGDGALIQAPSSAAQSMFRPENFRLTIGGLEAVCAKVSKVDAIRIKQSVVSKRASNGRDYELIPGKLEMPKLTFTVDAKAADLTATQEKTGLLEFLDATRQKALLTLELEGLGLVGVKAAERSNNEDKIASVTAEMYCEAIKIKDWLA